MEQNQQQVKSQFKVTDINILNLKKIKKIGLHLKDGVTYVVGMNGSGKSTIFSEAFWLAISGMAEKNMNKDFFNAPSVNGNKMKVIGLNGKTAKIGFTLIDCANNNAQIEITREIKNGTDIVSIKSLTAGYEINENRLKRIFNVFMINPQAFIKLNGKEQTRALGIITDSFDEKLKELKDEYTAIGKLIKNLTPTEVEPATEIDISTLETEKQAIQSANDLKLAELNAKKKELQEKLIVENSRIESENLKLKNEYDTEMSGYQNKVLEHSNKLNAAKSDVVTTEKYLNALQNDIKEIQNYFNKYNKVFNQKPEFEELVTLTKADLIVIQNSINQLTLNTINIPAPKIYLVAPDKTEYNNILVAIANCKLDFTEINERINKANIKVASYKNYLQQLKKVEVEIEKRSKNTLMQQTVTDQRTKYIYDNLTSKFKTVSVNEDGELTIDGRLISDNNFSAGERIKKTIELFVMLQPELKYVFLQDFMLMDKVNRKALLTWLQKKEYQVVCEIVGDEKISGENCVLISDGEIISDNLIESII